MCPYYRICRRNSRKNDVSGAAAGVCAGAKKAGGKLAGGGVTGDNACASDNEANRKTC